MTIQELPITGYVDRFSRRPGEIVRAHVSVRDGGPFRVRLVRVLNADPNPKGPGVRFEDLSKHLDETLAGKRHPIHIGSRAVAPGPSLQAGPHTWTALIRPGLLSDAPRVVFSHEADGAHLALSVKTGALVAQVTAAGKDVPVTLDFPVHTHRWYRVWVSADAAANRVLVGIRPLSIFEGNGAVRQTDVPGLRLPDKGRFLVAARNAGEPRDHFEGKIEAPAIIAGFRDAWPEPLSRLDAFGADLRAGWDFSRDIPTQSIVDIGPQTLHGVLKNTPTRAVRGASWSGREMRWKDAPAEYGAIHFHSDDLGDCEWPEAFAFSVPKDLRSGSYAFHITCAAGEDWIPFYVLPPRQGPHARVAFLAPTFTYMAYANFHRIALISEEAWRVHRDRVREWNAYPNIPTDYPVYGVSMYNRHPDKSGVGSSSRLRPILSMRPGFIVTQDKTGSGLRHYPADSHLLGWLEARGIAFDIVTDEDLHEEGASLLKPYACVLTGSHPEYHTPNTLDALGAYTHSGGRLCYLGGNGFYWRVGRSESLPHVIELRRTETGTRVWAAEPGEFYHASDCGYGGLWRRSGREPQQLVGVGFSAQGSFDATCYRRMPDSYDPKHAWMFEGVEGETFGDYGLSAGGAAGFEVDRADVRLGTPHSAVILARSEKLPASFYPTVDEMLVPEMTVNDDPVESLMHADMTYFETPSGGAVFSVGSITFCGSLWRNGFEGPVSRLVENVVRRFAGLEGQRTQ